MKRQPYVGRLPTVADDLAMGITRCAATCDRPGCHHSAVIHYADFDLPLETIIVDIAKVRRFVCSRCGSRKVTIGGDWSQYWPHGGGWGR